MSQTLSTIDSYLAFVAILVNFASAILVMVRTSRSIVHITFLLICLSVVGWNLGEFMRSTTGNPSWSFLSLVTSALLPTLMFHFVITQVSPQQRNPRWIVLAYTFSCILIMSPFFLQLHPEEASWNILYFILFVPLFLSILLMLIGAIRRGKSQDDKSRFRYMLIGGIIGVITVITDHIHYLKPQVPPLGHIGSLLYSSILAIGVFKHRTTYDILAQARERLEDLSAMAAGIAHEIRNPLTSIKGASSLLGRELQNLNHSKCQEYCGLLIEEIDRIDHILNNFRYFTKPLTVEKDLVSVSDVIQKTVKLADVGLFNLEIRLELSQEAAMVQGDASLMKQVFLNLIKNASEACGSEGELVIKTEITSPFVKITFSDNGPGIPADLTGQIFDPFFTTKATGMGMGLTITQKIIEAHHGRIEVTNLLPRGAEFSIFLPA
jgi:signal transduction histidine kinase